MRKLTLRRTTVLRLNNTDADTQDQHGGASNGAVGYSGRDTRAESSYGSSYY